MAVGRRAADVGSGEPGSIARAEANREERSSARGGCHYTFGPWPRGAPQTETTTTSFSRTT